MTESADPLVRRIVLTGAESTGKTELAAWLATHLDATASAEFARQYALDRGGADRLTAADVEPIARGQVAGEDAAIVAAQAGERAYVVHDTDLLSTVLYATHYYGEASVPAWVRAALAARTPDLYLLCETDVPFEDDPARDAAQHREALQETFREAVAASGAAWAAIVGSPEERQRAAAAAIRELVTGQLEPARATER